MNIVEILRAAKQHILHYGWKQKDLGRLRGPCCMLGAVYVVGAWNSVAEDTIDVLEQAVGNNHVPTWNDDPSRTLEEVLTAFDRAIVLAEAEAA